MDYCTICQIHEESRTRSPLSREMFPVIFSYDGCLTLETCLMETKYTFTQAPTSLGTKFNCVVL